MLRKRHGLNAAQWRWAAAITALSPLLMAADCNGGGSSDSVISLILSIVDLVLSIIAVAS